MKQALSLALADRRSLSIGVATAAAAAVVLVAAGQMVAWGDGSPVLLVTPDRLLVFGLVALATGLIGALQSFALRQRLEREGGKAGLAGVALAFIAASCCTPLVWPAVLSLLGVSGVTLLGLNAALHRWFWIPAGLAAFALVVAAWQSAKAIVGSCALPASD